jgi:hypothetical protein
MSLRPSDRIPQEKKKERKIEEPRVPHHSRIINNGTLLSQGMHLFIHIYIILTMYRLKKKSPSQEFNAHISSDVHRSCTSW